MKKMDVMAMVKEYEIEQSKTQRVPHYYKRNGKMVECSYPDIVVTERYKELFYDRNRTTLRSESAKVFRCECCGERVGYFDLELWCCDFDADEYLCAECYEDGMGDDL